MIRVFRHLSAVVLACWGTLLYSRTAAACAVCFGSPDSAMAQGAKAGILILLGVIGAVLTWIVAVTVFWIRRARRLQADAVPRAEFVAFEPDRLQPEIPGRNGRDVVADVER